uniref:Uncharacterized protein n=1 Tax=Anguilla anguilla TaxID=7936 RepID=A0A0E9UT48_ANGAN
MRRIFVSNKITSPGNLRHISTFVFLAAAALVV